MNLHARTGRLWSIVRCLICYRAIGNAKPTEYVTSELYSFTVASVSHRWVMATAKHEAAWISTYDEWALSWLVSLHIRRVEMLLGRHHGRTISPDCFIPVFASSPFVQLRGHSRSSFADASKSCTASKRALKATWINRNGRVLLILLPPSKRLEIAHRRRNWEWGILQWK